MAEEQPKKDKPNIVIRKIKKPHHGHHGGAWKIAYADFVTAMMAFFLLMWLLASLNKSQQQGVAEFFQSPLKSQLSGLKQGSPGIGSAPSAHTSPGVESPQVQIPIRLDANSLEAFSEGVDKEMGANPQYQQFKNQFKVEKSSTRLVFKLMDGKDLPLFQPQSAELTPAAKDLLHKIGKLLSTTANPVVIAGHTDAMPYEGPLPNYSNWELTLDRANAARRELVVGGLLPQRVKRVAGLGSNVLLDEKNPYSLENRYLSIVVLRQEEAQEATNFFNR